MHKLADVSPRFTFHLSRPPPLILSDLQLIEANSEPLALVESLDSGKPIGWSRADVADVCACLRYYAGWADKIIGQTLEVNNRTKQ